MIQLNKIEGKDIYTFTITGNVDKEGIEKFYKLLEEKAQQHQKMKLIGIINEFPGFEDFKAFTETIKMKFKALKGIGKYAILSDRDWVESVMTVGNFVTPGIPIKHFEMNEMEKAILWLDTAEDNTFTAKEYLTKMEIENIRGTNIYSFTVDGKIDEAGMTALYNILKDSNRTGKINLLATFKDFDGFENFDTFLQGVKVDFASFGNIDKYAILSDKKWISSIAKIESFVLPGMKMKGFEMDEKEKAMQWLQKN